MAHRPAPGPGAEPNQPDYAFHYNPSGTLQKVTDAKGHDTTFDYDASDRRITMRYAAPLNNQTQQWAYDDAGNLKSRMTVNGEIQSSPTTTVTAKSE